MITPRISRGILWALTVAIVILKLPFATTLSPIWVVVAVIFTLMCVHRPVVHSLMATQGTPRLIQYSLWLLIGWIAVSLAVGESRTTLSSWARLIYLCILLAAVSPLFVNPKLTLWRQRIFLITVIVVSAQILLKASTLPFAYYGKQGLDAVVSITYAFNHLSGTHYSMMGMLTAIAALNLLLNKWGPRNVKWWLTFAAMVIALFIAFVAAGRMAIISGIIGSTFIWWGKWRRFTMIAGFLAIIIGCSLSFPHSREIVTRNLRIKTEYSIRKFNTAIGSRQDLWAERMVEIKNHPIVGVGLGNATGEHSIHHYAPGKTSIEPGSSYLGICSQAGIPAGVIFLCYNLLVIHALFRLKKREARNYADGKTFIQIFNSARFISAIYLLLCGFAITEGFILAAGSVSTFIYWLTIGVAVGALTQNYSGEKTHQ